MQHPSPPGSARRPARRTAVVLGAVLGLLALQSALFVPSASAATTCTLINHQLTVNPQGQDITISRDATQLFAETIPCGQLTQIDTVHIDMGHSGELAFDLSHGPFGPGFTPEGDGSSEIEFDVTNPGFVLTIFGADESDLVTMGQRKLPGPEFVTAFNLNVGQDGFGPPDEDVIVHAATISLGFGGGGGGDFFSGQGTNVACSKPTMAFTSIFDGPGADQVMGGNGSDQIVAEPTPDAGDQYSGGVGLDELSYASRAGAVSVTQNNVADDGAPGENDRVASDIERITTGSGPDTLTGGSLRNILDAGGGNNTVSGGPGNDIMTAGTGTDEFHGGPGFDSVSFETHNQGINASPDGVADDGAAGEHDNVMPDVEGLFGSSKDDFLVGSPGRNTLNGGFGDDIVNGVGGNDTLVDTVKGLVTGFFSVFSGDDLYIGGSGKDTVVEDGHNGNLTLTIDGSENDQVMGDATQGVDNILTNVENLVAGDGNDDLSGTNAANKLVGGPGNDSIVGAGGNDMLLPGPGIDALSGGPGLDKAAYTGALSAITADLSAGTASGDGHDSLTGIERLLGSAKADHLTGSAGPNVLTGAGGADELAGLAGNDTLVGGKGNDSMDGGAGTDTCKQGPGTGPKSSCEH